jgi:carboxylesterase
MTTAAVLERPGAAAPAVEARTKPPVLLLHGLTGAPADLQSVTRHMRQAGFQVTAPMLPGHGVGEAELVKTKWRDWLAAAEAELVRLSAGGERVVVGGLSMGAVLSLALAARHPDKVAGVLCFAVTLRYDGWVIPKGSWFIPIGVRLPILNRYRFKERPPYGIKDERLRARMEQLLRSGAVTEAGLDYMPGKSLAENMALIRWTERRLKAITAPVFIAHAREDDITDIRNAERLAARVGGPVRKLYLDDSYHLVTFDRERNRVAREAIAFVQECCPA